MSSSIHNATSTQATVATLMQTIEAPTQQMQAQALKVLEIANAMAAQSMQALASGVVSATSVDTYA